MNLRCPIGVLPPGRDLAWFPFDNDTSLSTWRRLLLFNTLSAGCNPDSAMTTPRFVVRKLPVITRPIWLSSFCSSSHRFFTPAPFRSSHQSSAPYSADACTHATSAFLQAAGQSPICPVSRRIHPAALRAFFIPAEWCSLRVILESIQTPSHRVACLLKGTLWSPTRTDSEAWTRTWLLSLRGRSSPRSFRHSSAASAAFSNTSAVSFSVFPSAHHATGGEVVCTSANHKEKIEYFLRYWDGSLWRKSTRSRSCLHANKFHA